MHSQAAGTSAFDTIIRAHKQGEAPGITSICSANPFVVAASLLRAQRTGTFVLIESTCNQVNQFGGYTGMTPLDFVAYLHRIADRLGFPTDRILFGGDHLGPSVWQDQPADRAMSQAQALVRDCVQAGYIKIHLDASMKCADDPADRPLDRMVSASRAANLALAAEQAHQGLGKGRTAPRYVIGTEVPPPGGIQGEEDPLAITPLADVEETIALTQAAFAARGLDAAWQRVMAVVAQPGVEYGDRSIFDYQPEAAVGLARLIERYDGLVYEAHSTDYQTRAALRSLVRDHFAILKVGPGLTFAFREAVFALAMVEEELIADRSQWSAVRAALDDAMLRHPAHWQKYYPGTPHEQALARRYSLSDRARYYWPSPAVQAALDRLIHNLETTPIPLALISQYLPAQYRRIREGALTSSPRALIMDRIDEALADYAYACDQPV